MEEELGEPVPFWNWTEDDVPDLFEGITVPVKEGISAKCPCEATGDICGPSGRVTRRTDIKIAHNVTMIKDSLCSCTMNSFLFDELQLIGLESFFTV